MMIQTWGEVITTSFQALWSGFMSFLPNLLGAIVVFIFGWFVAEILGKLAGQIIQMLRVDQILERIGFKKSLSRANMKLNSSKFIGELVKWFFIIVFLMASTDILGLAQITEFLGQILLYIPRLIVAVFILLAGVLIANVLGKIVKASVDTAGLGSSSALSGVAKWGILIFAILAALIQLGIVPALMQTIFTGLVAALAISVGLSFGLGGKDLASQILEKMRKNIAEK
ncbi:hypothetical protein ACFLZ0_00250 [Patescibacteria group bacterium]